MSLPVHQNSSNKQWQHQVPVRMHQNWILQTGCKSTNWHGCSRKQFGQFVLKPHVQPQHNPASALPRVYPGHTKTSAHTETSPCFQRRCSQEPEPETSRKSLIGSMVKPTTVPWKVAHWKQRMNNSYLQQPRKTTRELGQVTKAIPKRAGHQMVPFI